MKVRLAVASIALLGLGGAAKAEILASGPVYGGAQSATMVCRIFNAGKSVNITRRQIRFNTNVSATLTFDTCNVPLGAGNYCQFGAPLPGNLAFSCKAVMSETLNVRGTAELSAGGTIFATEPMR